MSFQETALYKIAIDCHLPAILPDIRLALLSWQLQVDIDANLLQFDALHLSLAVDARLRTGDLSALLSEGLHFHVLADLALNGSERV